MGKEKKVSEEMEETAPQIWVKRIHKAYLQGVSDGKLHAKNMELVKKTRR